MASRHVLFEILEIERHERVHLLIWFQEPIAGKPIARRRGGENIVDCLGDTATRQCEGERDGTGERTQDVSWSCHGNLLDGEMIRAGNVAKLIAFTVDQNQWQDQVTE
jgi:hypothetical protein